jgi:hypothetical protein
MGQQSCGVVGMEADLVVAAQGHTLTPERGDRAYNNIIPVSAIGGVMICALMVIDCWCDAGTAMVHKTPKILVVVVAEYEEMKCLEIGQVGPSNTKP